jgi:hypothetical protein
LYTARGESERPARLQGAAGALREAIAVPLPPESHQRQAAMSETLAQRLGGRYHDLLIAGAALTPEEAIAEALEEEDASSGDPLAASLHALDDVLGLLRLADSSRTGGT